MSENLHRAINAIERVVESPEDGAQLSALLETAHESLEQAILESDSLEENSSLSVALMEIEDLEAKLASEGSNMELDEAEVESLKTLVEELKVKIESLDIVFDYLKFAETFDTLDKEFSDNLDAALKDVKPDRTNTSFGTKAEKAITSYDDAAAAYYAFMDVCLEFGMDYLPDEVASKLDQYAIRLQELGEEYNGMKRCFEFSRIERDFLPYLDEKGFTDSKDLIWEELGRFRESFEKTLPLPEPISGICKKHLSYLSWNESRLAGGIDQRAPEYRSTPELMADLDFLENNKDYIDGTEFDQELMWLTSNILFLSGNDDVELPGDYRFYTRLIDVVEWRVESETDNAILSYCHIMLSQLNVLARNAERTMYFVKGVHIWHQSDEDIDSGTEYYDNSDYGGMDGGVDSDSYGVGGAPQGAEIAEVSVAKGAVRLNGSSTWKKFSDFENSEYFFGDKDGPSGPSILDALASSGGGHFLDESREHMEKAQRLAYITVLEETNKEVDIVAEHIPERSLLAKYLEKAWVKIKDGKVDITCPDKNFDAVYQAVMKQFLIEPIYAAEEELYAKNSVDALLEDPFFEARKLFLTSQRELASNDIYSARGTLVKFMEMLELFNPEELEKEEALVQGREFALSTLRSISFRSLSRIKQMSSYMFGMNEDQKEFQARLDTMIDAEWQRLEASDGYEININNLTLPKHWSEGFNPVTHLLTGPDMTYSTLIDKEAHEYACKSAGIPLNSTPNPDQKYDGPSISADNSTDREREMQRKKMDRYEVAKYAYLRKHYPGPNTSDAWNDIVRFESPENYDKLGDAGFRAKAYERMGDKLRTTGGAEYRSRGQLGVGSKNVQVFHEDYQINPEASVMYYREALGDDIADAEFELAEKREEIKERVAAQKEEYREKAVGKIKDMLKDSSMDDSLKAMMKAAGVDITNFDSIKAELHENDEVIKLMADSLMEQYTQKKLDLLVYEKFATGKLGSEQNDIWEKINDSVDPLDERGNLSDRTADFLTKELVKFAIITAVSMGMATVVTSLARGAWLAVGGVRAAQAAEAGHLGYRLAMFGTEVVSFTVAEKSIRHLFLGQNTWGTFMQDLGMNTIMLGSVHGGKFLWTGVAGKHLVGSHKGLKFLEGQATSRTPWIASDAYASSSKLGQAGLRGLDWVGGLGTEVGVFTTLGISEKMLLHDVDWEDINVVNDAGMSLATILALRGGNKVFSPAYRPILEKVEVRRTRMLEDMDHGVFLTNKGLAPDFLPSRTAEAKAEKPAKSDGPEAMRLYEAKMKEADRTVMEEYRAFVDKHGLSPNVFKGKSPAEVREAIEKINDLLKGDSLDKLSDPPTMEVIAELAKTNPVAAELIARKMYELNFTKDQLAQIAERNPDFIVKFGEKMPNLEAKVFDKAVKEYLDRNVDDLNLVNGELSFDNTLSFFDIRLELMKLGFKVNRGKNGEVTAKKGPFELKFQDKGLRIFEKTDMTLAEVQKSPTHRKFQEWLDKLPEGKMKKTAIEVYDLLAKISPLGLGMFITLAPRQAHAAFLDGAKEIATGLLEFGIEAVGLGLLSYCIIKLGNWGGRGDVKLVQPMVVHVVGKSDAKSMIEAVKELRRRTLESGDKKSLEATYFTGSIARGMTTTKALAGDGPALAASMKSDVQPFLKNLRTTKGLTAKLKQVEGQSNNVHHAYIDGLVKKIDTYIESLENLFTTISGGNTADIREAVDKVRETQTDFEVELSSAPKSLTGIMKEQGLKKNWGDLLVTGSRVLVLGMIISFLGYWGDRVISEGGGAKPVVPAANTPTSPDPDDLYTPVPTVAPPKPRPSIPSPLEDAPAPSAPAPSAPVPSAPAPAPSGGTSNPRIGTAPIDPATGAPMTVQRMKELGML
jgi:hypothetical protein